MLFGGVVVIVAALGGGAWYWFHAKAEAEAERARQATAALQQKRASIHTFYTAALTGADIQGFLQLYGEILQSRQPIELSGFSEDSFSCTTGSCDFSYKAGENTVFSIQQKRFRGTDYPATFSQDSVDYTGIPSQMNSNPVLDAFNHRQRKITEPVCNDILNYFYSYNSLADPGRRFTLTELPVSSVTSDEDALPGNPENLGLLVGKWSVSLPDSPLSVFSFWKDRPYAPAFIFQSVTKKNNTIDISGTFLCKK